MKSILDHLAQRCMCRSYQERSVPQAHLVRILDAARKSPSAGHSQGVRFLVVSNAETRRLIAQAYGELGFLNRGFEPWLSSAPVHLVVASDESVYQARYAEPDKRTGPDEWGVPYSVMDVGKALMSLYLAAQEYGLSCGYLGPHAVESDITAFLPWPANWRSMGLVTVGYRKGRVPKTHSIKRGWRPFDEVVKWVT